MRITNTTMARNYTSNLNRNLNRLNSANTQVAASGRKIFSMSDDTATGTRAMNIRRSMALINGYMDNAKNAQNKFESAEKSLGTISDMSQQVSERLNYAMNGTNSESERNIIANELEKLQSEILSTANGQYSDRYMFGGTNTMSAPFTIDANGYLMYNNVKVADISDDPKYDYLKQDAAYVDIGLGMSMIGTSQNVNPNSAFKNTINGLDFMGTGDTNLYDTITDIIKTLRDPAFDIDKAGALLNQVKEAGNNVNLERTRLGSDSQYLDFTVSRLEDETFNLTQRQDTLEFRDPAEAIMDFSMQQYVYTAALQMGSRLLQPNIFNFIN